MRFHLGSIPTSPDFEPQPPWRPLREPSPWVMQILATHIGVALAFAVGFLWYLLNVHDGGLRLPMPLIVCLIPSLIIIHELIHAAVHPMVGRSNNSILGCWPSRGVFYAYYDGEMTRNRLVTILLAPLVVLSFLPLSIAAVTQTGVKWIAFASVLNALFACGDVFGAILLLWQLPADAVVRNQGYFTYWRPDEAPSDEKGPL